MDVIMSRGLHLSSLSQSNPGDLYLQEKSSPAREPRDPMESPAGEERRGHRFVLVHGVCHGAWSWYRVATALRSAGHRVDALDMAWPRAAPGRAAPRRWAPSRSTAGRCWTCWRPCRRERRSCWWPGGPQLRRPEPGAGHAGAPGQGRRRCLRLRRHAGRREAPQVRLRTVRARKGAGFLHGLRDRDHRRRRPAALLQDVPARAGVHGGAAVPAQPAQGPDAGDDDGEAVAAVRGRRRDDRGAPDGGEVRRGEPRVRRRRGGRLVLAAVPAADGLVEPRHGGEGPPGRRPHAHVLQAQGALRSPRGDSQQVHLNPSISKFIFSHKFLNNSSDESRGVWFKIQTSDMDVTKNIMIQKYLSLPLQYLFMLHFTPRLNEIVKFTREVTT